MFRPIGDLLPGALGRLKVAEPVEATLVCNRFDQVLSATWDHAVPMRAIKYQSGAVTVAVTSAAWAHEVTMRSEQIKEAANRKLGAGVVNRIRTKVAPKTARGED